MAGRHSRKQPKRTPPFLPPYLQLRLSLAFLKATTRSFNRLSNDVLSEVCHYIAFSPVTVSRVAARMVLLIDVSSKVWRMYETNDPTWPSFTEPPASTCIGALDVFVCGGFWRTSLSRSFIWHHEQVLPQADMLTKRHRHALLFDPPSFRLLVFGGDKAAGRSPLTACESFHLVSGEWTRLPSMMHARSQFNVCRYARTVFVCGGGVGACEKFRLETMSFVPADIDLPSAVVWAVVSGTELVVLGRDELRWWDLRTGKLIGEKETHTNRFVSGLGVGVHDGEVLLMQAGHCVCFSMETGTVTSKMVIHKSRLN